MSNAPPAFLPVTSSTSRGEFFAALLGLGCVNGLGSQVIESVNRVGWIGALSSTFGVSVIVWFSCVAGISMLLSDRACRIRYPDFVMGAAFLILVILPIGPLSWFAITALCFYVLISSADPLLKRGATVLFATTVPMLWSRMLFRFFANAILQIDASLVGWLLGAHRVGNLVDFKDGSGSLVILPSCSSLANVSLALLCWVTLSQCVDHKRSASDIFWCLTACASVVTVNVIRISLMGLNFAHYDGIHNQWGDAIVNIIIFGLTVGFCVLGVRREFFSRS
jgi:hypothetical protein